MNSTLTIYAILGAGNDEYGIMDSDGIQRCDLAIEMLASHNKAQLILCGGFGEHFNTTSKPHYHYLKAYIESKLSTTEAPILGCVDSYNTIADLEGINEILQSLIDHSIKLVIITNDYHVARSSILAKKNIVSENITVQFLSVSSLKDEAMLSRRLNHEFCRINEYFNTR